MNKKDEKELIKIVKNTVDNLKKTVDFNQKSTNLFGDIIKIISELQKIIKIIGFMITILVWRVFFWESLNAFFYKTSKMWALLSEGYRLLILGFIGTIIAGIIAHIAGSLLLEKIKNILKKK